MRVRFDIYPNRGLVRRGPGWAYALVRRDAPWWRKAQAIRGVRFGTRSKSFWLWLASW